MNANLALFLVALVVCVGPIVMIVRRESKRRTDDADRDGEGG